MTNRIIERANELLGDRGQALERKQRMDHDAQFLISHLEEWRKKHPNNWVAVYDGRLVAVEPSKERLLETLQKVQVPLDSVLLDFLSEEKPVLIL